MDDLVVASCFYKEVDSLSENIKFHMEDVRSSPEISEYTKQKIESAYDDFKKYREDICQTLCKYGPPEECGTSGRVATASCYLTQTRIFYEFIKSDFSD